MNRKGAQKRSQSSRDSRIARFESLESRELLSASGLYSIESSEGARSSVCWLASVASASTPTIPLDELRSSASDSAEIEVSSAVSTTVVVTTASDVVNANDGVTSLREALASTGVEKITFASSLKGKTIKLTKELTVPKQGVTIDASSLWNSSTNAPGITLDANFVDRVFLAKERDLSLIGLRLVNGKKSEGHSGGAIYLTNSTVLIDSCVFENNTSGGYGGAIAVTNDKANTVTIVNSKFIGNKAEVSMCMGGGIYVAGAKCALVVANSVLASNSSDWGGAVAISSSEAIFRNVTVANNVGISGGGGVFLSAGTLNAYNTIFALNTAPSEHDVTSTKEKVNFWNCLVSSDLWNDGENNVIVDPNRNTFIDASSGDYRLAPYSKAVDAGDAQYALDGQGQTLTADVRAGTRILGANIDIGAYERNPTTDVCTNAEANVDYRRFLVGEPYFDADKTQDGDSNMCWAAAASDLLWYTSWGRISGVSDEEELFHTKFHNNFPNNNEGYDQSRAIGWFLNNEYYSKVVKKAGGYYKSRFKELSETSGSYVDAKSAYGSTNGASPLLEAATRLRSGVGVSVLLSPYNASGARGESHALAVYGYEYNPTLDPKDPNYYTSLYVVDSNDFGRMSGEKDIRLITLALEWRDKIKIGTTTQSGYVVTNYTLSGYRSFNVVVDLLTYLSQRPSKYESDKGATPNLYFTEKLTDANPITISQTGATGTTYVPDRDISVNFAFHSTLSSPSRSVQYKIYVDDELVATGTYKGLTKNRALSLSETISIGRHASGTHFLTVALETGNTLSESNENDNVYTTTFTVSGKVLRLAKPRLATSVTSTSIVATWEKVPNASKYEITCGGQTITKSSSATSCEFTGLTGDTTYEIVVRALGNNKTYLDSYPVTATVKTEPAPLLVKPNAPSSLVFTEYSATAKSVVMSWTDNSDNETGFIVEYRLNVNAEWRKAGTLGANKTSRTATNVEPGQTYYFRVASYNDSGQSDWTMGAFTAPSAPDAPSNLVFAEYSATEKTVKMSWTDNSDNETGFLVEYRLSANANWRKADTLVANITSRAATNVEPGQTYYFRVASYNDSGQSDWTTGEFKAVVAPSALVFTEYSVTAKSVVMSWTDNSDNETGFIVEYRLNANAEWRKAGTLGANKTSRTATNVEPGQTYYFRVATYNAAGQSDWAYGAFKALVAPTLLSGDPTEDSITLTWAPVVDARSYKVEYAPSDSNGYLVAGATPDAFFTLRGLASRVTYNVRVQALGDSRSLGDSDYSAVGVYRTPGEAPTFAATSDTFFNGAVLRLNATARLSGGRVAREWRVSWGDGSTETISRLTEAVTLAHYYAPSTTSKTYSVSVELIDSTGGGADEPFLIATHTAPGNRSNALFEPLDFVWEELGDEIWDVD